MRLFDIKKVVAMIHRKYPVRHLILSVFIGLTFLSISGNVQAVVFTVNSTNDANDGSCNASHCSLREAIIAANANADMDAIVFNIPAPHTIRPLSALPIITSPVIIDGTTEPDYAGSPIVVLDGLLAGTYEIQGLHITAGNSTIKGLVIHRFSANGIYIRQNGGNIIEGNYIGLDVNGTATLPNGQDGINIFASPSNRVGGTSAQQRNVISGNNYFGVVVGSIDSSASGNLVQGNFIGTNKNGTTANLGNRSGGVAVSGTNNIIGGTVPGARNVISGNISYGVYMNSGTNNRVQGNYIGVDVTGAVALGNSKYGVEMLGTGLILGGDTPGAGNVISGNGSDISSAGIHILSAGNTVAGNYIGTNAAGTSALPNNAFGVWISNAANNIIGGITPSSRNLISGNQIGIYISNAGARDNVIQGNYIGTNAAGNSALPNGDDGITIFNAHSNLIGGTVAGSGNTISGNGLRGVGIDGINSALNRLEGNFIGTEADGLTALGNGSYGVQISRSTGDNTIGGTQPGAGNTIAFNGADGIFIDSIDIDSYGNGILTNRIYSNGQLGIDLNPNNVNPNDTGDVDNGMNYLQNFPTITQAISYATSVGVTGTLNSASNTSFRLEFFASPICDSSGHGEAQYYLGTTNVTTDGSGNASFSATFPGAFDLGAPITATATDPGNNTSEFSACIGLTEINQSGPNYVVNRSNDNNGVCGTHDCSLREAINAANADSDTNTISFGIPGSGVHTIQPVTPLPWVTNPVIIDGTTQPGYALGSPPVIAINGANAVTSYVLPAPPIDLVGINIVGASNSTVRGLVVNGWGYGGVGILNGNNNIIEGNFIGTNATGTAAVPNLYGVIIYNGSNNRVGGTTSAQRNVISGNNDDGVNIGGQTSAQAVGNIVQGNYIGTNVVGTGALGNGDDGVKVEIADGTIIGGTGAGAGNIIAASVHNGIILKGANTVNSLVQGNYIGTDVSGTVDLGNSLNGVFLEDSPNNAVGGITAEAGNWIAFSTATGVNVTGATAISNAILGNTIFANGGLGLDIAGDDITANDTGDSDTGANNRQNYPVVSTSGISENTIFITGTLNSQPNQIYRIELFANATCDPSGSGEGQTYLGFTNVTTDGSGDTIFSLNIASAIPVGQLITATATDPNYNTSEFSACTPVIVISAPAVAPMSNYSHTTSVPLTWAGVTWATGYIVQWDDNAALSSPTEIPLSNSFQSLTITVPGNGVYHWRVGARKADGGVVWGAPQKFAVEVP